MSVDEGVACAPGYSIVVLMVGIADLVVTVV